MTVIKKFYGKQIYNWLHSKLVRNIHDMTNISLKDRNTLDETSYIPLLNIVNHQTSKIDGTEKFLFKLEDGNTIETVFISLLEVDNSSNELSRRFSSAVFISDGETEE